MKTTSTWQRISETIDEIEAGPSVPLGTGNHGFMGDGIDPLELEMNALQDEFRCSYEDAAPATDEMDSPSLYKLLQQLDPDFSADTFAPEDEDEMRGIYGLWADRMSGHEEPDEDQDH
jgi:hypothetical protein